MDILLPFGLFFTFIQAAKPVLEQMFFCYIYWGKREKIKKPLKHSSEIQTVELTSMNSTCVKSNHKIVIALLNIFYLVVLGLIVEISDKKDN